MAERESGAQGTLGPLQTESSGNQHCGSARIQLSVGVRCSEDIWPFLSRLRGKLLDFAEALPLINYKY